LACADGSFIRQIMSAASVLPDSWSSRNISVSPDGQKLAICANAGVADGEVIYRGGIYLLDLSDYSLSEVYLGDYRFTEVDWSADGQYVGYIRYAPAVGSPGDVLEILHVGTLTTSQILDVESVDPEGHSFILEDFDWSPDGTKINYRVDLLPRLTPKWYVEDITCDPQTHTCTLSNQRTLNWPTNGSYRLSWLPDASANVAMYAVSEDSVFLEIRGLNGELIRRAELDDLSLTSGGYCGLKDAVLSPNGERVAFKARSAGSSSLSDIFILSLNDMSVLNLTSAITSENVLPKGALFCQAEWLP
jgi:hypothetical protein